MNKISTPFHAGPDRPKGTRYVGSMPHERNKEVHTNHVWIETGLDEDRAVLWTEYVTEDLAASRLWNWMWSNNYSIHSSNVNEIVLLRTDKERTNRWLVWRRVQFIAHEGK